MQLFPHKLDPQQNVTVGECSTPFQGISFHFISRSVFHFPLTLCFCPTLDNIVICLAHNSLVFCMQDKTQLLSPCNFLKCYKTKEPKFTTAIDLQLSQSRYTGKACFCLTNYLIQPFCSCKSSLICLALLKTDTPPGCSKATGRDVSSGTTGNQLELP